MPIKILFISSPNNRQKLIAWYERRSNVVKPKEIVQRPL
jgi:hypothetical protein